MLNPAINYRGITRAATTAIGTQEAEFFDIAIAAEGSDAYIDTDPQLDLTVYRGKPKVYNKPTAEEIPTVTEPRATTDVFAAPRSVWSRVEHTGGRSLFIDGLSYTIAYVKPHKIGQVITWVEIHADLNDGLFQPTGTFQGNII